MTAVFIIIILLVIYAAIENKFILLIRREQIKDDGVKIVHIGDLHHRRIGRNNSRLLRAVSKEKPDIVIINTPLPDDFGTSLALDVSETDGVCVLLFTRAENFSELSSVLPPHGVLTLPKPTSPELTEEVVELMCATRERLRRIEIKKSFAEGRMEDIRVVNKAKWFLIEQLKMTEQEAHRYIEKQAMDWCVTKRVIAENILSTYK